MVCLGVSIMPQYMKNGRKRPSFQFRKEASMATKQKKTQIEPEPKKETKKVVLQKKGEEGDFLGMFPGTFDACLAYDARMATAKL